MGIVVAHAPLLVVIFSVIILAIREVCGYAMTFLGLNNYNEELSYQYNYVDHVNTHIRVPIAYINMHMTCLMAVVMRTRVIIIST